MPVGQSCSDPPTVRVRDEREPLPPDARDALAGKSVSNPNGEVRPLLTRLSAPIEFKASRLDASGEFEGHGSTFGNVDLGGDVVERGAFRESLADHKANDVQPGLLWSHDPKEPVGRWLDVFEDDVGLKVRGKLSLAVPRAAAAHALMKDDALGLSIGYAVRDGGFEYDRNGIRHLRSIDLFEVSLVALPMNRRARISAVKSAFCDIRSFERLVRDEWGLSARDARRLASGGWHALTTKERSTDDELRTLCEELRAVALRLGSSPHARTGQGSTKRTR